MDLENQQRVKDAAEKYGPENVVVVLGSSDAEGAEIYAETVTKGDPTFAGPLAGVPLGLAVYHIFEEEIRQEADPAKWEEQIAMMEMVLDPDALAQAVKRMREEGSKYTL
ncbi:glycine reductase complex selenoprotein A [Thermovirga lienii DSM 17291]|jgi:betaine reductase|uniref:Glycine reductase complex selenoprotein A n=3 Tax=Thermovirga TaxID=336260 RepID=G7V6Z6_THELD|nr:glycine reductase complex selenoprotein A [Thermovirga lienii DSM 17291]KUK42556.1 MAG: Glycine reductase complex selenoprotein A [Thermovirga lienii]MDN5318305.1 glycine/sarcosine/betaine reductase complex component [Thermovirga sp.]MDN5367715.1 glycine/sarcosine/betaine reductase complex component [Thermovirga sp.]